MTTALSPDQREARRAGKLDQRCLDCGTTSAASSWCCGCGGRNLEYREHLPSRSPKHPDLPVVTQWCQQDNRPKPPADPVRQARGRAAAVAQKARKASVRYQDTP